MITTVPLISWFVCLQAWNPSCREPETVSSIFVFAVPCQITTGDSSCDETVQCRWRTDPARWKTVDDLITHELTERAYLQAQASMARLNRTGAVLMHKYGAHAGTDVTGFGILGHLNNLASNQKAAVSFRLHTLPIIRGMANVDAHLRMFKLREGYSAETSGEFEVVLLKRLLSDLTPCRVCRWPDDMHARGNCVAVLRRNPEVGWMSRVDHRQCRCWYCLHLHLHAV